MNNKALLFFLSLSIILTMIVACKHHPDLLGEVPIDDGNVGPAPPDTLVIVNPDPCDPDTVYFQNTILPILLSNCAMPDCHDAITHEEDVRLYDYDHIMDQVEAGDLGDSDLYEVITEDDEDDMMPPPDDADPLTAEQVQAIRTWILQGARNNGCQEDCNPSDRLFGTHVMPIVTQYCQGNCHAGGTPSGDLSLETYDQVRTVALDGRLMSALHGTDGYAIMPDQTTGLPDCYISRIQNWVNDGAPNN